MKLFIFAQLLFIFANAEQFKNSAGSEFLNSLNLQLQSKTFTAEQLPKSLGGKNLNITSTDSDTFLKLSSDIAVSDEAVFQDVIKDVYEPIEAMLQNKNIKIETISTEKPELLFAFKMNAKAEHLDSILKLNWTVDAKQTEANSFNQFLNTYLREFKKIESVEVNPFSMKSSIADRDPKTFKPIAYLVENHSDIRGTDQKNWRRNDRFSFSTLVRLDSKTNKWKISKFNLTDGETLKIQKPYFSEVQQVATQPPSIYLRREAIRRGGYALSMCDWDNDGIPDMIVGQLGAIEFFKGTGKADFNYVSSEKIGVEKHTLVKSVICDDFDHDGIKDLLLVRFVPSDESKESKDIVLYKGVKNGLFAKSTSIQKRLRSNAAMPAAVADFNNDGLLDFYVGFPGVKDFTVLKKDNTGYTATQENHPQGLFFNKGNFTFEDVTPTSNIEVKWHQGTTTTDYPEAGLVFPHTSTAIDYNLDGHMDIVVVDDKANLSPLYKNLGDGKFTQVAEKIGVTNFDFGMGFVAADFNNTGTLDFVYTNVNFIATERMSNSMMANFSKYTKVPGNSGLRLFRTKDAKNYSDVTALSGINFPGYGVGGVEAFDFNNDGFMDLYVANGLWSGNTKKQDISSLFSRSYIKNNLDYQTSFDANQTGIKEANSSYMKILTGFSGDITTGKPDVSLKPSMSGYQRNRLYRNNKDGTFTEIGYLAGVDSVSDGYVAATADLNADGKIDLILRNADPGTEENKFASVQVFKNNSPTKNKSVILSFQGVKSNTSGIGMIAIAEFGGKKLMRHLVENNGAAQAQTILHFGLGEYSKIDKLTLKWPSGTIDSYNNVTPGHHKYVESYKKIF